MTQEFDPKTSYLAVKAHEKMIAYVGFGIRFEAQGQSKEGVIKISSFHRPYGGGYITLTFIVDTEDNKQLKANLKRLFEELTEDSLRPYLGADVEKIVSVSLDALKEIPEWYIEEISVHFKNMDEREDVLIDEKIVPALKSCLAFSFDPVEWWPADKAVEMPEGLSKMKQISLKKFFQKWFKTG
jgi:hypothetical protein